MGCAIGRDEACMRCAHLDIHIDMSLLVIMEINVGMTLILGHLWCVLFDVHCALHPCANEFCKNVTPTAMATNYISTKLAQHAVVAFGVHGSIANARPPLCTGPVLASQRLSQTFVEDVHAHPESHTSSKLLIAQMVTWRFGEVEPGSTTFGPRFAHIERNTYIQISVYIFDMYIYIYGCVYKEREEMYIISLSVDLFYCSTAL